MYVCIFNFLLDAIANIYIQSLVICVCVCVFILAAALHYVACHQKAKTLRPFLVY